MLDEIYKRNLLRFGITAKYIDYFNERISKYLASAKPIKLEQPAIIFSDVHANLPALELVFKFANENNIESFISLGDLIEYNTFNNEVLDLIKTHSSKFLINIKGNHDDGVMQEDKFVSTIYLDIIRKDLGEFLVGLLHNGLITINGKKILMCHSNPWNLDVLYMFPGDLSLFDYFLRHLEIDGIMFGHTHLVTFYQSEGSNKFVFNPGSLGIVRDGSQELHFAIIYPEEEKIVVYNIFDGKYDLFPEKSKEFTFKSDHKIKNNVVE